MKQRNPVEKLPAIRSRHIKRVTGDEFVVQTLQYALLILQVCFEIVRGRMNNFMPQLAQALFKDCDHGSHFAIGKFDPHDAPFPPSNVAGPGSFVEQKHTPDREK